MFPQLSEVLYRVHLNHSAKSKKICSQSSHYLCSSDKQDVQKYKNPHKTLAMGLSEATEYVNAV